MKWTSVRSSVCLSHRSTEARRAAGLLLSGPPAGDIIDSRCGAQQQRRRAAGAASAANAGSVMLTAEGRG